jgi:N-methylhydantoinase A
MPCVVVPPAAGLFSAVGLLHSDLEHQTVHTYLRSAAEHTVDELNSAYRRLEEESVEMLVRQGYDRTSVSLRRYADVRYADQGYELTLPVGTSPLGPTDIAELVTSFGQEHLRTYGHRAEDEPVDIVNLRVTSRVASNGNRGFDPRRFTGHTSSPSAPDREAYFGAEIGAITTPVIERSALRAEPSQGPLIVEEADTTCVIPPGCTVRVDDWGNLVIEL